ncbi:MAG: VWA domain-containing protein [Bacteroidales bacterium]|jgi:Ca-activated chloride channel family protein|nr:VWA domain-containing protein [Bacteroidales bacterium]
MSILKFFSDFFHIIQDVKFANPYWFLLLIPFALVVAWQIWKRHKMQATVRVSTAVPLNKLPRGWRRRFFFAPLCCECMAVLFLVGALARPQSAFRQHDVEIEGVDIVLALDISGSMKAMDFKPNRLGVTKKVAANFIEGRPTDRIGLVVYAGEAYTQCPVTSDHATLLGLLDKVAFDKIEDGTAIGDGLGTAINRLRDSEAKSKIIILLSDGVNNMGYIDPRAAAEIAKDMKIKVYTIGCGSNGQAPYPTPVGPVYMETEIDEALLKTIATETGGLYFRANNAKKLEDIYKEIDQMEKTIINEKVFEHKADEFSPFLVWGLFFFILFLISKYFIFRINP